MDKKRTDLTTWQIEEVLQAFDIPKNENHLDCARTLKNGEECEGGFGYDLSDVITSDNELVNLYYCKECGGLSYQIINADNDPEFEDRYLK